VSSHVRFTPVRSLTARFRTHVATECPSPLEKKKRTYKYTTPRFVATLGFYLFVCLWFIKRSSHLPSLRASNFRHVSFKHGIALRRANTHIFFTPGMAIKL
jgi:hypothetical protein